VLANGGRKDAVQTAMIRHSIPLVLAVFVAPVHAQLSAVPPPVVVNPAPEGSEPNLSELQYRPGSDGATPHREEADNSPTPPPLNARFRGAGRAPRWNASNQVQDRFMLGARQGTLATLGLADAPPKVMKGSFDGAPACTAPVLMGDAASNCCSYSMKNEVTGKSDMYRRPKHAFADEASAIELAKSVRASMPMYLPYKDSAVKLGQGWLYEGGNFHGALDYSRSSVSAGQDPSFKVYSVADGKVLAVYWDDLMGNAVIIEHKAPNGDRYRTVYVHLRDGFDHDLAKAKAVVVGDKYKDGKATRPWKYKQYADKPNPSQLQWGTNAQKIQVKVGDTVRAGQLIGWSGNTGHGGAGNGLDDNGNPTNPTTANNHLHLMTAVPHPTAGENEWVQIDPYGVYAQRGSDCYDLTDDTAFVRLFAPFYPSFHNVPVEYVAKYFGYYPGMGMALQTLSLHKKDSKTLASGSFQHGLSPDWYARFWMTGDDYQHWFNEYHSKGYRPRQLSVALDNGGNPRFSVIWQRRQGEQYVAFHGLDDAGWTAKWNEWVVQKKFRVEDRVGYSSNGRRQAAVFVKDDQPFVELHYMNSATLQSKFNELWGQGFRMVSIDVDDTGSYGGVWLKKPGGWIALAGMSASGYQDKFTELASQGWRLHRIDGYANSSRFAAIWTR
jgi:murein DD-endopeptidase MepM/ murein hydrolase activator NlpD